MSTEDGKTRAANIFDVARLAGVSYQTVSRVLNDLPNVRPATRERVEQAIQQLRYVPSSAARALVTRRSRVLGLIIAGAPDFGVSLTALNFATAAREARYAVSSSSMLDAEAGALRSAAELLIGQNVEAIVLIADQREALDVLQNIELGVPLVAIASQNSAVRDGNHRVAFDQFEGAKRAVEHLAELGHREIRHVAGPVGSMDATERMRGWRIALGERGLRVQEPLIGDWTPASGHRLGVELAQDPDVTAVFAANDEMAIGVMHALQSAGRRIPGDLSVVGFDDIPAAEHLSPPLTTIKLDFATLGRDAFATVLSVLRDDEAPDPARRLPALVTRDSTAAPRMGS